jgi:hypothetical protein
MSIFSKFKKLSGADRVIDARNKIASAIETEKAKLLAEVAERFAAVVALRDALAANALNESVDLDGASGRVTKALESVGRRSVILAGLRHRLSSQAGEFESQYRAIKAMLPDHVQRLRAEFAGEWAKSAAAFSAVLGKRKAIEALVGRLELPDPSPLACELPADTHAPWRAAEELSGALEEIAGFNRVAIFPEVDAMGGCGRTFDSTQVYVVKNSASGVSPGTLVVDAYFPPGMLAHLLNIGYVELAELQAWQGGLATGSQAAAAISSEAQADMARGVEVDRGQLDREREARVPINQRRPSLEDDPEWRRQREAAQGRRLEPVVNPEHVGTMTI